MVRPSKFDALKDQWHAFQAEWGYHLFFWLFLSFLAALVAAGKIESDESAVPSAGKSEQVLL